MATQVLTRILCDVCNADGLERDGSRQVIGIGGTDYEFDSCDEHGKSAAELAALLSDVARPIGKQRAVASTPTQDAAAAKPILCPTCGKGYKHTASLRHHVRQVHGTTLASLTGEPAEHECDVCGDRFGTAQGLAVHRSRSHKHA